MKKPSPTQEKIHEVAKRHFLENGFQRASLRKIVSDAGFTLGAFYGYYGTKEDLFCALTQETAETVLSVLEGMAEELARTPDDRKYSCMTRILFARLPALVDFLLLHPDETRLLLTCAEGTRHEHFLSGMMEQNLAFMKEAAGMEALPMHPLAQKLLVKNYFSLFGEAVLEGSSREEILAAMQDIQRVFSCGMRCLLEEGRQENGESGKKRKEKRQKDGGSGGTAGFRSPGETETGKDRKNERKD